MTALTEEQIITLADKCIDEIFPNHPAGFGNKERRELGNKEAIAFTAIFVSGYHEGLQYSLKILNIL
jgi:hypothetical protein